MTGSQNPEGTGPPWPELGLHAALAHAPWTDGQGERPYLGNLAVVTGLLDQLVELALAEAQSPDILIAEHEAIFLGRRAEFRPVPGWNTSCADPDGSGLASFLADHYALSATSDAAVHVALNHVVASAYEIAMIQGRTEEARRRIEALTRRRALLFVGLDTDLAGRGAS